jgi:colicin import membrane protein
MARTGVTYEQVAAVAEALVHAGEKPTARRVRQELGAGSMGTITTALQKWRGEQPATEVAVLTLPDSIGSALAKLLAAEIEVAVAPYRDAEVQARKDAADLVEANGVLDAEVERLKGEVSQLTFFLTDLNTKTDAFMVRLEAAQNERNEAVNRRERAELEHDRLKKYVDELTLRNEKLQAELLALAKTATKAPAGNRKTRAVPVSKRNVT